MKYYLRTNTEAEMMQSLDCLKNSEGFIPADTHDYSLVIIGALQIPAVTEVTDGGDINVVTPAVTLPGFHANYQQLQGDIPPSIAAIVLNPEPGEPLVKWI